MNRNTKGACKTHSNKTISRHIFVLQAPDSSYAKSSLFTNSCKMKPALRVLDLSETIPSDPLPSLPVHSPAHSIQLNILHDYIAFFCCRNAIISVEYMLSVFFPGSFSR